MAGILSIQINPTLGNKELNLKKVEHFIKKYSDKKLDLVVLPENFSTGADFVNFQKTSENKFGGSTIAKICEFAQKYKTNIVAGTVIEKDGDKFYNTAFVVNREGEIVAKYRKIHLYNYLGGNEGDFVDVGEDEVVIDLDFGKIGLGICFDIRFPNHFTKLAQMGAQIIVLPTGWLVPNEIYSDKQNFKFARDMWIAMARTRAYDNLAYFVISNQAGRVNNDLCALGESMIIAPTSEVLNRAEHEQCAIYSNVDLDVVKYYRSVLPIV